MFLVFVQQTCEDSPQMQRVFVSSAGLYTDTPPKGQIWSSHPLPQGFVSPGLQLVQSSGSGEVDVCCASP